MKNLHFLCLAVFCSVSSAIAQAKTIHFESPAASISKQNIAGVESRRMQFATPVDVDYTPNNAGSWEFTADSAVWNFDLEASSANSVSLSLINVELPESAKFWVSGGLQEYGPFSQTDIKNGKFWTPLVLGNQIKLRLEITISDFNHMRYDFKVAKVNNGHIDFWRSGFDKNSGSCNVDTACAAGDAWRDEIRSVARYVIDGAFLCTGTLVNNTASNGRPLFLTAFHCIDFSDEANGISPSEAADSIVAYWGYESASCGERGDFLGTGEPGASLLMYNETSDTALMQLSNLPAGESLYLAGWDNRTMTAANGTGIHHPAGDVKSISIENNPLTITHPGEDNPNPSGEFLRVSDWDLGTTEGGSSGSAIWNENHHIVGTLLGGFAACGNNESDWYGRVYSAWSNSSCRDSLNYWLDPQALGTPTLDGTELNGVDTSNFNQCDTPFPGGSGGPPPANDAYEENDTPSQAYSELPINTPLSSLAGPGIVVSETGDEDYFEFTAATSGNIRIDLSFQHSESDLSLVVLDADENVLGITNSNNDNESLVVATEAEAAYIIGVFANDNRPAAEYDLIWKNATVGEVPQEDDAYEHNDAPETAIPLNAGEALSESQGLATHRDDDFYRLQPDSSGSITITLDTPPDADELYLVVFDEYDNFIDVQTNTSESIHVSFVAESATTYYALVGHPDQYHGTQYDLSWDYSGAGNDDAYEQNDSLELAFRLNIDDRLSTGNGHGISLDDDWYSITSPRNGWLTVEINFLNSSSDLDLSIHDSSGVQLAESASVTDSESVTIDASTGETYYIRVYAFDTPNGTQYDLSSRLFPDDEYEENDSFESAHVFTASNAISYTAISIDDDYYQFESPLSGDATITVEFDNSKSDINLTLYDATGTTLATATSKTNKEIISFTVKSASIYVLQVYNDIPYASNEYNVNITFSPEPSGSGGGSGGGGSINILALLAALGVLSLYRFRRRKAA